MPWTSASVRPAASRAERELLSDPCRSDELIAAELGCSNVTVWYTRQRLEQAGAIPAIPPPQRIARPRQPSQAALAVALGASTPAEVAEAAGVTIRTAQRQIQRARPELPDVAAATDSLSVLDTTPDPGNRATEALLAHPKRSNYAIAEAAGCDEATVRRARARLERAGEILEFVTEEREPKGPPGQPPGPTRKPPAIRPLPAPPNWSEGRCAHVPPSQQSWWTSADPVLREAAANICTACPVLEPCAQWSLSLPVHDPSVYGAMTQTERLRRKAEERRIAAETKPSPRNLR